MYCKLCKKCKNKFKTTNRIQKCCSRLCAVELRPHKSVRHLKTIVECDFKISDKCKKSYSMSNRAKDKTLLNNDNKIICLYCSRQLKHSGRNNPNVKYTNMKDNFFEEINTDEKAYILGWIASDGNISKNSICIQIHERDAEILLKIKNIVCKDLELQPRAKNQVALTFNSHQMVEDVCKWLDISHGKKSHVVKFPNFESEELSWGFIRGFFDGDGHIAGLDTKHNTPLCQITSNSADLLNSIKNFVQFPGNISSINLSWTGNNALDFAHKLYDGYNLSLNRKKELYLAWCGWVPGIGGVNNSGEDLLFKWVKTCRDAVAPSKVRASDSGYDLTILSEVKKIGEKTTLYTTGIKIQPAYGWYMDVVPRSSIIKSGYILANSVGVIDRTYKGEIMIALTKIDDSMPDIELPLKIAQMIPRPIVNVNFVEVDFLDESERNEGGFGSTGV